MTPAELLGRLHDRFRLLRGGARGGLERQRTLAATLDWSYSLVTRKEGSVLNLVLKRFSRAGNDKAQRHRHRP